MLFYVDFSNPCDWLLIANKISHKLFKTILSIENHPSKYKIARKPTLIRKTWPMPLIVIFQD